MKRTITFVWDNFGPMHHDRLSACVRAFPEDQIVGIEVGSKSSTYDWEGGEQQGYIHQTLFPGKTPDVVNTISKATGLIRACLRLGKKDYFFCNYELPYVFISAVILRLLNRRVYIMQNSKFNDFPRFWLKELLKVILYFPYCGALVGSPSTRSYLQLLGFRKRPIVVGYNTLSINRIRDLAGNKHREGFANRSFMIVARLVPKKNLAMSIRAYAMYAQRVKNPRRLEIFGNGPLEAELKGLTHELGVAKNTIFHGFAQSEVVAPALGQAHALILPSIEEQFGNVVIEAQALGTPVLVSNICGACDELVRNGTNGFTFSPDDITGLAYWMEVLHADEILWERLSDAAPTFAAMGDSPRFAAQADVLIKYFDA